MAGDWLKMEISTPDKPEVLAITAQLGWDDPDTTVGKLFRVWRWFDQQTVEGNAAGVTAALLDRIVCVSGFAQAMANVGWLVITADGISLPNFDRHNGETAKQRAQTAKRVAKHKTNGKGNGASVSDSVTAALPREDKREDKESSRATRLPDDWEPSPEDIQFCIQNRPDLEVAITATKFKNHWLSKSGKDATKRNWALTWQNWVLGERPGPNKSVLNKPRGLVL